MTGALVIFIALQVLGWFGYQASPEDAAFFQQSPQALLAIRILIGPFSVVGMAWFYPLTRERRARIHRLLARMKERSAS